MSFDLKSLVADLSREEDVTWTHSLEDYVETLEVGWTFRINSSRYSTELLIGLDEKFPRSLPMVILRQDFFDDIKWIPHVDHDRKGRPFVCIFDTKNSVILPNRELALIRESISRARTVIEDGIACRNVEDFQKEFQAYWGKCYGRGDRVEAGYLFVGAAPADGPCFIKGLRLTRPIGGYHTILLSGDSESEIVRENLTRMSDEYHEIEVAYVAQLEYLCKPPYNVTTPELVVTLEGEGIPTSFLSRYIKSNGPPHLFVARVPLEPRRNVFAGWDLTQSSNSGYRNTLNKICKLQSSDLKRLIIDHYSKSRLLFRTVGSDLSRSSVGKVCFVGLGSVGSQLYQLLQDMEFESITFVDNDLFKIENLKRHVLGIDFVGQNKASAMARYAAVRNPELNIGSRHEDIRDLLGNTGFLTEFDWFLISIGIEDVEREIRHCVYDQAIMSPVVFFWVEPFLCAGHALYLPPYCSLQTEKLLYTDGLFLDNLVAPEEYRREIDHFFMVDAGCQDTYLPYSGNDLRLFLATILSWLNTIFRVEPSHPLSITWVGNMQSLRDKAIRINDAYQSAHFGQTYERTYA